MDYDVKAVVPEVVVTAEDPESWRQAWEEQVASMERAMQLQEDVFPPADTGNYGQQSGEVGAVSNFTRMPRPGRPRRSTASENRAAGWEGVDGEDHHQGAAAGLEFGVAGDDAELDEASGFSNPRYKTEICRNFKERSRCIYGDQCQFAHGRRELRDVVRNTKYKTKLCQKYWMTGYCAYGPRCNFLHNESDSLEQPQKPQPPHHRHHHHHHHHRHHGQHHHRHHHHHRHLHNPHQSQGRSSLQFPLTRSGAPVERSASVGDESLFFGGSGAWDGNGATSWWRTWQDGEDDSVFGGNTDLTIPRSTNTTAANNYSDLKAATYSQPPRSAPPMALHSTTSAYPFDEDAMMELAGFPLVDTWSNALLDGDEAL